MSSVYLQSLSLQYDALSVAHEAPAQAQNLAKQIKFDAVQQKTYKEIIAFGLNAYETDPLRVAVLQEILKEVAGEDEKAKLSEKLSRKSVVEVDSSDYVKQGQKKRETRVSADEEPFETLRQTPETEITQLLDTLSELKTPEYRLKGCQEVAKKLGPDFQMPYYGEEVCKIEEVMKGMNLSLSTVQDLSNEEIDELLKKAQKQIKRSATIGAPELAIQIARDFVQAGIKSIDIDNGLERAACIACAYQRSFADQIVAEIKIPYRHDRAINTMDQIRKV